jgi:hypothetical protein
MRSGRRVAGLRVQMIQADAVVDYTFWRGFYYGLQHA